MGLRWGIDVSEWQPDLPWPAFVAAGMSFAVVRLGDGSHVDTMASAHLRGAKTAGVPLVAAYWFARDSEEPTAQAARYRADGGRMGVPVWPDWEKTSRQVGNRGWLPAAVAELVAADPKRALAYYADWYGARDNLDDPNGVLAGPEWWCPGGPYYSTPMTPAEAMARWPNRIEDAPGRKVAIWQASEKGRIPGYDGPLDLNVMDDETFSRLAASAGNGIGGGAPPAPAPTLVPRWRAVVSGAEKMIGTTEAGIYGSNKVLLSDGRTLWQAVGHPELEGQPWCYATVNWWLRGAGVDQIPDVYYTPSGVTWAERQHQTIPGPRPGAVFFIDFCACGEAHHVGICTSTAGPDGTFDTIEGNTSAPSSGGSQDNGGGVYARTRNLHVNRCWFWWPPQCDEQTELLLGASWSSLGPGGALARTLIGPGATGGAVRAMQEALTRHGFPVTTDGEYGPATEAAVRAFQTARGLTVDGWCGPVTWAALDGPGTTNEDLTMNDETREAFLQLHQRLDVMWAEMLKQGQRDAVIEAGLAALGAGTVQIHARPDGRWEVAALDPGGKVRDGWQTTSQLWASVAEAASSVRPTPEGTIEDRVAARVAGHVGAPDPNLVATAIVEAVLRRLAIAQHPAGG